MSRVVSLTQSVSASDYDYRGLPLQGRSHKLTIHQLQLVCGADTKEFIGVLTRAIVLRVQVTAEKG